MSESDEYIVHGELRQKEKADAWHTASGLLDVDGLKISPYLLDIARQHIEGDITIDEAREEFDYSNHPMTEIIKHLSQFISDLWQIHPFREDNTRTTTVFLIMYLRSMGIPATNDWWEIVTPI